MCLQGMKAVAHTWENINFNVQSYFKGNQKHGFILGAMDETLLNVDNDIINLQSMAGSRFVGPFLGAIQQWEKDLSLISETVEVSEKPLTCTSKFIYSIKPLSNKMVHPQVWLLVQRKWMYLESIFTDEDIRSQLPAEAKNFDNINNRFKEVSWHNIDLTKAKYTVTEPFKIMSFKCVSLDNE